MSRSPDVADLVEATRSLTGRLTQLVELSRGLSLNHVLHSGTVTIPAAGNVLLEFTVPMAAVAIIATDAMGDVTAAAAPPTAPAPVDGLGVIPVPPGTWACVPMTGTVLTVYGQTGDRVYVAVYSKPQPPGAS